MAEHHHGNKKNLASLEEIKSQAAKAGVLVIDVRNSNQDPSKGGEEEETVTEHTPLAGTEEGAKARPNAINLVYNRETQSMELPPADKLPLGKDTPIITHCGGGGRGGKSKKFLEANGFTNVLNGGGPKASELWDVYSSL